MPKAVSRLEILQVCKLLQCVREKDKKQIQKLTANGVPHLINYNDPDEGNTALHIAAIANDDDMIEFLLEQGAHPDVMDLKGRTSAMRACEYGHVNCLEKLLAAGANMKLTDLEGKGILFYCIASTERHLKCMELACEKEADVNNKAKDGTPIFMVACETAMENEQMCLKLIEKGANTTSRVEPPPPPTDGVKKARNMSKEQQLRNGRSALMAACTSGSAAVVKEILRIAADLPPDNTGKKPVSVLVDQLDMRKNHAAHFAATGGHLECIKCLAAYGAHFDQTNMDGNTPIHMAAFKGHEFCCKYLSQRGCNPKPKNNEGSTARVIAKDQGHKAATKELRKAEKTFGKTGKNNDPWILTFYDWLMENQDSILKKIKLLDPDDVGTISKDDFVDILTGMEAPVDEEELKKLAALHDKSRESKVDYNDFFVAKKWVNKNFLMSAFEGKKKKKKKGKKGGKKKGKFKLVMPICTQDEGPRTFGGCPPEQYIPRHIHFTDVARFDRDHPPKHPMQDDSAWYLQHPDTAYININEAAKNGDFESMKQALQKGVHVDTRDRYYKTPLMTASAAGHLHMVKYLVEKGAQINWRDNFKWTALHHACHAGMLDIVQFLVENGGEIDASTMNGGTPLTRAIESSRDGVVQYLIDRGAKMQTENKKGMTPLDIAQAWADPRVFDIVQRKWDTLPSIDNKKKGGKGAKGKGSAKGPRRPETATGGIERLPEQPPPKPQTLDDIANQRKGSILRAASALAGGMDEKEDITYHPLRAWTDQKNTKDLIHDKEVKRQRFGWEVDFPDFQMPFNKNVSDKMAGMDEEE